MNNKEALEKIKERLFLKENDYVKTFIPCILKISQDLEKLEELEKDFEELKELNQFNYKSVKCEEHNYKLLENEYIKLEKENQELKERYKHRAETSKDLCKAVKQYEKALNDCKGYIRSTLAKKLKARKMPDLIFKHDEALEYGNHINELLASINKKSNN